jgi:hypothetical protein
MMSAHEELHATPHLTSHVERRDSIIDSDAKEKEDDVQADVRHVEDNTEVGTREAPTTGKYEEWAYVSCDRASSREFEASTSVFPSVGTSLSQATRRDY